jgi:hypothetical protein
LLYGKHIFATLVQPDMMAAAQPSNIQRFVVAVVMGIYRVAAAHLATLFPQRSRDKRPLHCQMRRILGQVGTAPVV